MEATIGTAEELTLIGVTTDRKATAPEGTAERVPAHPAGTIALDVWDEGNPTFLTLHPGQARRLAEALHQAIQVAETDPGRKERHAEVAKGLGMTPTQLHDFLWSAEEVTPT